MPTPIIGQPVATAFQLRNFLHQVNPGAPDYANWFISIGRKYGVRGDIAFCQAVLETGYWRFGGSVLPSQNNFGGIGATTATTRGVAFPTPEAGIEAMIQHLYAYATLYPLPANTVQLDPRFHLVNRGIAPYWEDLSGRWAADPQYGAKILALYDDMIESQASLSPYNVDMGNAPGTPTLPSGNPGTSGTMIPAGTGTATTNVPGTGGTAGGTAGSGTAVDANAGVGGVLSSETITPPLNTGTAQAFTDVPREAWFAPFVQRAAELGILRGRGNGRFDPDQPATRAELAVALVQLYNALNRPRDL